MEYTDGLGTDAPAGFGYAGDSAGASRSPDHHYRAVAKEINQGIADGHNTQLDHPSPPRHIAFGGCEDPDADSNGKRLSPTRSKYSYHIHIFILNFSRSKYL